MAKRMALCILGFLTMGPVALAATAPPAYLTTPTACDTVERVEAGRVWLRSPEHCAHRPGRVRIDAPADVGAVEVYVNGALQETQVPQRYDLAGIDATLTDAETLAGSLQVDRPGDPASRAVAEARKSADFFASAAYQSRLKAERERLQESVFAPVMKEYYPEGGVMSPPGAGKLAGGERVYVFISSSIPDATLRAYLAQADQAKEPNLVFVLRGLVGGAKQVGPTLAFLGNVLREDEGCDLGKEPCATFQANVQVDPLLFARYQITQVPALVYARNVSVAEGFGKSEGLGDEVPVGQIYRVDGDAALDRLLELINREARSGSIEQLIAAMRKGFY